VISEETSLVFETGPRSGSIEQYDDKRWPYTTKICGKWTFNDDTDGSWSRIETTLAAGTYYVIVEGYYSDESFEYALLITER